MIDFNAIDAILIVPTYCAFTNAAAPRIAASLSGSSETRISTLPLKIKRRYASNDLRTMLSNTSPAFAGPPNRKMASEPLKVAGDSAPPESPTPFGLL